MIRGYVAIVSSDLPLSKVPPLSSDFCRKATIRLVHNERNCEFTINVEGSVDYAFKVLRNVRRVDKSNIINGCVRIGFIVPNLDIVISSSLGDLKAFVYTMEVIKNLVMPLKCSDASHYRKIKCICQTPKFAQYQRYECRHISHEECPFHVSPMLCLFCSYHILEYYNHDDARKIINTWKSLLWCADNQEDRVKIQSVTVNSYPCLTTIFASGHNLTEIPEALGSLPCLAMLDLSDNRLGQAMNWKWLTSPFIRESLLQLTLDGNGLSKIPEDIGQLKNLELLSVCRNQLIELPPALKSLNHLREIGMSCNNVRILPSWMYREERYIRLELHGNNSLMLNSHHKSQLNLTDFNTGNVPSLFAITSKYIITERLAFWEHNLLTTLRDYLESAYYCRCGSVVFCDTSRSAVQCRIKTEALAHGFDVEEVVITIHCCSSQCFHLMESYLRY